VNALLSQIIGELEAQGAAILQSIDQFGSNNNSVRQGSDIYNNEAMKPTSPLALKGSAEGQYIFCSDCRPTLHDEKGSRCFALT